MLKSINQKPAQWMLAALTLALAGGALQLAHAAPHGGPGMGGPGGHGGGMMMAGRGLEHMLDQAGATAEQRASIKQIADAARTDMRALHQSARPLHEQMQKLFVQPAVDAAAVEVLRRQMLDIHAQGSARMTRAKLDISAQLTLAQRQQIAERMGQRKAMLERHMRERGALERSGS